MNECKEYAELPFRCAITGRGFQVRFWRRDRERKFVLLAINARAPTMNGMAVESARPLAFNADDFDLTGWHCPHCGHAKAQMPVAYLFIKCTRCQECVCGARVKQNANAQLAFQCHDGCGNTGLVDGKIQSYAGAESKGDK